MLCGNGSFTTPSNVGISGCVTMSGSNCNLLSPPNVLATMQFIDVRKVRTCCRKMRGLEQLHNQFLGTPLGKLQSLPQLDDLGFEHKKQAKGRAFSASFENGASPKFFSPRQTAFLLPVNTQFNVISKFVGRKLKMQNRMQRHGQSPVRDTNIIKAPFSPWREGIFLIRCSAFVATIAVLGVLFLYGQARAQAYIDERILPSVATAMGNYLGRKLNLGRVQRVSPLGLTLQSCSLGPHAEEFSCGELPSIKLRLRPLASLQQGQIVVDAVLSQPHILIAQKEDWTWLGIPTPSGSPSEKHSSNEEGIDPRTKARRLAREQTAIRWARERNEAARKWAHAGYNFKETELRSLGKDDALHAAEMVTCDSMNCIDEEVSLEQGFDVGTAGGEEHLHHKCTEGVCNRSGMDHTEKERVFSFDRLDGSSSLRNPALELKIWLNENIVRPIRYRFRRKIGKKSSLSEKATMQRRNLDHSAAAARTYFEKMDKRQRSDAEDGGGYIGNSGVSFNQELFSSSVRETEYSQEGTLTDQNEEGNKNIINNVDPNNSWQITGTDEKLSAYSIQQETKDSTRFVEMDRKNHVDSCQTLETDFVYLRGIQDVLFLDKSMASLEQKISSGDQSSKHLCINYKDNARGPVYEALVQAIHDLCSTTESCKPRTEESVCIKSSSSKSSSHCSETMDGLLRNIAEDLSSNQLDDIEVVRIGTHSTSFENSLQASHGEVAVEDSFKEKEEKKSQNIISQGCSPVLASLRSSRDMTPAKPSFLVNRNTELPVFHDSVMKVFSDNFITSLERMEGYLRRKVEQFASEFTAGAQERVQVSENLLPVALDSVHIRGGTLMLLGYGDQEPRVMENIIGHLKFQNRYERLHVQVNGRLKEWRIGIPSKDGGKLFVNVFVDLHQQKWHVNIKGKNIFAPLFERLLEIPIFWSNGRASGEVHVCMSKGEHFPNLHGQLDVKGLEFQIWDTPSSFSALNGSLCFRGQRIFLHNASCNFGLVPLEVSGDFGINPEDGEYHLMCQVPNVEINALMKTLNAKPLLFPLAGSLKAVFNCQGPLDVPVFVGSGVISRKNMHSISDMPSSVAAETVRQYKDAGAVAAFDRVPFSYVSANFTFNTDNCMADLYGIRASLVDGGEIRGAGNAWICPEGEMDDTAVDANFSGNVYFDNVVRHYVPGRFQVMPMKLGDVNGEAKVYGSILRPRFDIKWTAPKAEGSFTDSRGDIIISHEAITISSSSIAFDLLTKIQMSYPHVQHSKEQSSNITLAMPPDIDDVDVDLRMRGYDVFSLSPSISLDSPRSMHMKLTGKVKFQGRVVKSTKRSTDDHIINLDDRSCSSELEKKRASGLFGEIILSGIKLNQLLVAPHLTGSLVISPQSFKMDARGRPDENLLVEITGALHPARSETPLHDLLWTTVSLSLQKGQLRTSIYFQPGNSASLEVRNLPLDELEFASLRGMVHKAELQLNFQKRRGQGILSVMRPRFSGVQGESLDVSARWSGDVITIEKFVLEQPSSRYELQGEYVLPGTRDRFLGGREKEGGMLKRAMAGQLGNLITSMGRWRLRLEVPGAEVAEMLPFARLLSRSSDPAVLSRSKELFMQGVHNVGFYAENLQKQLEATQVNKPLPTDEATPEAIPLPGLAELKGRWHGSLDASGGGNGDTKADFDFHGDEWEWGAYKTQKFVAVGSYSNNDGLRLDKIFIQRDKATLHADGTLLGPRPNLHFAVLNFPVGLVPPLLQAIESSTMDPMLSSWTPLTPIRGILHMEGDLRGSLAKPQCDVQVRLLDGAIGGIDLGRADVVASITSTNRLVFNANFEPVIQSGHVHVRGSLPVAPLGTDALEEEDTDRESNKSKWVREWIRDKGNMNGNNGAHEKKMGRDRGDEGWEVHLTEGLKGLDWNVMENGAVKVDATVKDGGMMLITALSPYIRWLQGSADIILQVRGTIDQPIVDGAATFHKAYVSSPVLPRPLSNFGGTIHVKSNRLCINGLEGRVGRKGRLLVKGRLPLRTSESSPGDMIEMKSEILEVRAKNIFSGQVDSQIQVAGSIMEPEVSGMIKFSRGEAYLPQEKATGSAITHLASKPSIFSTSGYNRMTSAGSVARLYSTESVHLPVDMPVRTSGPQDKVEKGKEQSKSKPRVAVHLRGLKLNLGPELRIVYPLILNFAVSGELELTGLADPKWIKPKGTLTFDNGDVNLVATQVRLKRDHSNRAKFEPDQGLDPTLDLVLVGSDWQLKVQGRASNWQDNLVVTSTRSGEPDVLTPTEAARVFESQLAESLLEGDGQLAFKKLAAATVETLMPRIEGKGEFGQARWRLVSAPQIPNLLSLDSTIDPFKSLANISFGTEVEVQLGKRLQASVVRQLKESEMATQWTLLYQLSSRLRVLFQSIPSRDNRLLFEYSATSQN